VLRRLIVLAAVPVLIAGPATAAGATTHAARDTTAAHQLIPLYVYPAWWNTTNDWHSACSQSNAGGDGSTIIAPVTGVSGGDNPDFAHAIALCHGDGQNVIGYVDTGYAAVPLATAEADIDSWYADYDGSTVVSTDTDHIDGIFLDEMANFPDQAASGWPGHTVAEYYSALYAHIKALDTTGLYDEVIGNPGAPSATDWQINQAADELVVFEGSLADYGSFTLPAWAASHPASDIAELVYDVPAASVASTCASLRAGGAGLVDVTHYTITGTATPWNFLQNVPDDPDSSYWNAMRSACG
jgi:hypothetical protein